VKPDQTIYRPSGRVVTRRIGTDNLLVPVSGGVAKENAVFPVNETGLFVWERLSGGKTVSDTAQQVTEQFAVDLSVALADCNELLLRLIDEKLLEEVPA
jgi:hypothetical protein